MTAKQRNKRTKKSEKGAAKKLKKQTPKAPVEDTRTPVQRALDSLKPQQAPEETSLSSAMDQPGYFTNLAREHGRAGVQWYSD